MDIFFIAIFIVFVIIFEIIAIFVKEHSSFFGTILDIIYFGSIAILLFSAISSIYAAYISFKEKDGGEGIKMIFQAILLSGIAYAMIKFILPFM